MVVLDETLIIEEVLLPAVITIIGMQKVVVYFFQLRKRVVEMKNWENETRNFQILIMDWYEIQVYTSNADLLAVTTL